MKALLAAQVPGRAADYAFEFKWDGIRALAFLDGKSHSPHGGLRLLSRNNLDATFRYPEIAQLSDALGHRTAILDGEIIATDEHNNPSFPILQKRMHVTRPDAVAQMAREVPVQYVLFDILYLDGQNLRDLPWTQRRERLESLQPILPPACRLSPARIGRGADMLHVATEKGLEGIVAKRIDSAYEPGERSGSWLKIKLVQRQELVIGGWVPEVAGTGQIRNNHIGSILLGYYDKSGKLHHAGAVGTGFTDDSSADMVKRLKALKSPTNPFGTDLPPNRWRSAKRAPTQWVKPELVVEVEYRRWPQGGLMHQAAYKGLREDKPAKDVIRELPIPASKLATDN